MRSHKAGSWLAGVTAAALAIGAPALHASAGSTSPVGSAHTLHVVYGTNATSPQGLVPSTVLNHYFYGAMPKDNNGNTLTGTGQTIAVVLWGYYPEAAADLQTFISQFSLAPMLGLNGTSCLPTGYESTPCFEVSFPGQVQPNPSDASNDQEYALDIEWAHAAAPGANIDLVEGQASSFDQKSGTWSPTAANIDQAIEAAATSGASVVSMSFGGGLTAANAATWDGNNVAFVSGEGDDGFPETSYPAADANVLSVGGTNITPKGEPAWVYTGGGVTAVPRPGYQLSWTSGSDREVNDVAYNAEGENATKALGYSIAVQVSPTSPVVWDQVGGVSAGIPQWAGILADTDQLRISLGKSILARSGVMSGLYLAAGSNEQNAGVINPSYFTDVTTGCAYEYTRPSNGRPQPPCVADAAKGYDQLTGLGTPNVGNLVDYLGFDL